MKAERSGLYPTARRAHLLPEGEGRGEGKQTTARRSADVFDLSWAHCLKCFLVLSRSRFQASGYVERRSLLRLGFALLSFQINRLAKRAFGFQMFLHEFPQLRRRSGQDNLRIVAFTDFLVPDRFVAASAGFR